jgi:hypothetical protein
MATVSKATADSLIANDGMYEDDPRVVEITVYDNAYGGVGYGLTYQGRPNGYLSSPACFNPKIYWKYQPKQ